VIRKSLLNSPSEVFKKRRRVFQSSLRQAIKFITKLIPMKKNDPIASIPESKGGKSSRLRAFTAPNDIDNFELQTEKKINSLIDNDLGSGKRTAGISRAGSGHLKDQKAFSSLTLLQYIHSDVDEADIPADSSRSSVLKRSESIGKSSSENCTKSGIWVMRFSYDGQYLATGRHDGTVNVWQVNLNFNPSDGGSNSFTSGFQSFKRNADAKVQQHVFHPDPYRIYSGHTQAVTDLSWSVNGLLISASADGTVRLWHVSHNDVLCIFEHSDFVCSVIFHPFDDNLFATGTFDGRIRIWDIDKKKLLYWNEIVKDSITAIAFTSDASSVIVGTLSGTVVFYDFLGLKYNTQINVVSGKGFKSKEAKITGIVRMPPSISSISEERILITSGDSRARLFHVKDKSLYRTFKGFDLKGSKCFASFSSDGEYIVCATDERQIIIWDTFPPDSNQQYSGVLSAVMHRYIDSAKTTGQEKFIVSGHPITSCMFLPTDRSIPTTPGPSGVTGATHPSIILIANDHGTVYVFKS
jgi:WD40 repeat protein